jgi:hypothetical protein
VADGKQHPNEAAFLRFLERPDQGVLYVLRSVSWIRETYPGSVATMIPQMRRIYREKKRAR